MNVPNFDRLTAETHFFFVRHGESEGNRRGLIQGRQDAALSDRGREQAVDAGRWFRERGIAGAEIYSSPLTRAMTTARLIAQHAGLPEPVGDERLLELDTGIFSGLSFGEIRSRYPAEFAAFQRRSWDVVPEAESSEELASRATAFWEHLIERAESGRTGGRAATGAGDTGAAPRTFVCVSHGGMLQWILKVTFGDRNWMPLYAAANCGIFHLVALGGDATATGADGGSYVKWERINEVPYAVSADSRSRTS